MATSKTREKILNTSLRMFNEKGERNVTTNHIAAEAGISPGNLYYHFRNKNDIVYDLFLRYRAQVEQFLKVPDRNLSIEDKTVYFEEIFRSLWDYRFIHFDLQHLLTESPELRKAYGQFAGRAMQQARYLFKRMGESGIVVMTKEQIDAVVLNIWVVSTSWIRFLHTTALHAEGLECLTEPMLRRGIYQIISLDEPYLTPDAKQKMAAVKKQYLGVEDEAFYSLFIQ
ncbi:MAG TPA: TetR/AcrR family transcriptional regulator [Pseudomonadales bacterium]|nr:TetR/AcrR family transcriptional regulator [Pseudomonadales bacterium]